MNHYALKFTREAKKNPSDWVILPLKNGGARLIYIGKIEQMTKSV